MNRSGIDEFEYIFLIYSISSVRLVNKILNVCDKFNRFRRLVLVAMTAENPHKYIKGKIRRTLNAFFT